MPPFLCGPFRSSSASSSTAVSSLPPFHHCPGRHPSRRLGAGRSRRAASGVRRGAGARRCAPVRGCRSDRRGHRGGAGRGRGGSGGAAERHAQGSDRGGPDSSRAHSSAGTPLAGADAAGISSRGAGGGARRAASCGHRATDDAALVESIGVPVRLVPDSSRNLKVTTREDLALAELLAVVSP